LWGGGGFLGFGCLLVFGVVWVGGGGGVCFGGGLVGFVGGFGGGGLGGGVLLKKFFFFSIFWNVPAEASLSVAISCVAQ